MKIKSKKPIKVEETIEELVEVPQEDLEEVVELVGAKRKNKIPVTVTEEDEEPTSALPAMTGAKREAYLLAHTPYRILTKADIEDDAVYGVHCPVTRMMGYKPGAFLGFHGDYVRKLMSAPMDYPSARYLLGGMTNKVIQKFNPATHFLLKTDQLSGSHSNYYVIACNWRWGKIERPKVPVKITFKQPEPKKSAKLTFKKKGNDAKGRSPERQAFLSKMAKAVFKATSKSCAMPKKKVLLKFKRKAKR